MKKKMTEFISFRVSPEVLRKLTEICEHNQESRSQVLVGLITGEYVRMIERLHGTKEEKQK